MIKSTFWKVKLNPKMLSLQWFVMIIKMKWGNQNHSAIEEKTTLLKLMTTTNTSLRPLENRQKWKKADSNKDFFSPNHFETLQDDVKENDHNLTENDPIDNNSDLSKDKEKQYRTETQKQKLLR